jgi:hypothetical protein
MNTQVGDRIDGLGRAALRLVEAAARAADLQGLGRVRKSMPVETDRIFRVRISRRHASG